MSFPGYQTKQLVAVWGTERRTLGRVASDVGQIHFADGTATLPSHFDDARVAKW